jgi:MoaA/NifB/PqqE/SkfB family radical SAM enzyme
MRPANLIFVSQGEPFLHHDLFDLIHQAKEAGLHVTLYSNGTLLEEKVIKALLASLLDVLKVSLWASSLKEYEANYPGTNPEIFHRVVAGLKLLAEIKAQERCILPLVELHYPINRYNFQGIEALVGLAQATGCQAVFFEPLATHRGRFAEAALTREEEELVCRTLVRMKKKLRSGSLHHNINKVLRRYRYGEAKVPCYISWLHVRILVDGTVLPCDLCDLPVGNLNGESLQDIWNSEALRRFRRQTLTREGLRAMDSHCDCGHCCYLEQNVRVHRVFNWFSPFMRP